VGKNFLKKIKNKHLNYKCKGLFNDSIIHGNREITYTTVEKFEIR